MDSTCDAAGKLESNNLANQEGNKPEELTQARLSELIKADTLKLRSFVETGWRLGGEPKNKASMTFPFFFKSPVLQAPLGSNELRLFHKSV